MISFFVTKKCQKMWKNDENCQYWRRKPLYHLNDMSNFNEMFRKDVTWDNIKNSQKTRAFYRRCIYGKTTEGIKLTLVKFLRVNPDTSKQALEIAFSHKKCNYSWNYIFYNLPVVKENIQKHLSLFLNIKSNFLAHINEKIKEVNKVISVIKKLNQPLPYSSLMTRYKSFVRPHLDYGDSFFFLSGFSFTDTDDSQDSRGREGTITYF